ncbi:LOW QUALITY PROTEIN: hypothetical protein ACHAXA_002757, partial [Cyclostephanos tholiformis]
EPLIAFPLVLPMGWKNSSPIFSTATETIADLANMRLAARNKAHPHPLDDLAESILPVAPAPPTNMALLPPIVHDPSLARSGSSLSYVDLFVYNFVGLAQDVGDSTSNRATYSTARCGQHLSSPHTVRPSRWHEPVLLKKLRAGDCSWDTIKLVLGWFVDTRTLIIQLPPHQIQHLSKILATIPCTQRQTSLKKWHLILGELRSMAIALPGAQNIFSTMQNALAQRTGGCIALHKGVYDALDDFWWMHQHISSRPTRIAELVPLLPVAEGHHDASGAGVGGIWFPSPSLIPRKGYTNKCPLAWWFQWPQEIINKLVTDNNPHGSITNSVLSWRLVSFILMHRRT